MGNVELEVFLTILHLATECWPTCFDRDPVKLPRLLNDVLPHF